jgi:DNA-binding NarL/FixJ family response regulator
MRLFIADDSSVVRDRLRNMLAEVDGVEISGEADDGVRAQDAILRERPDVVILDLRMPWRNGLDVLREIKRGVPGIVVIVLTNYPYPQYRRRCMEEGADHFFNKAREFHRVPEVLAGYIAARS